MPWHPKFLYGDAVWISKGELHATIVEVDLVQDAYVVEVDNKPGLQLIYTDIDLADGAVRMERRHHDKM